MSNKSVISIVKYYPDINYIPNELEYLNILIDRNVQEEKLIMSKSSGSYWEIYVLKEHIDNDFLTNVRKLDINNFILPKNTLLCNYYDNNLNIIKKFKAIDMGKIDNVAGPDRVENVDNNSSRENIDCVKNFQNSNNFENFENSENSQNSNTWDDFLKLVPISYYPLNNEYIDMEDYYNNLDLDYNHNDYNNNNNNNNEKSIRLNKSEYWNIMIEPTFINKEFFVKIRELDINNVKVPNNAVCCIYYNMSQKKQIIFWANDIYKNKYNGYFYTF